MNIRLANQKDKASVISMANRVYYDSEREFWKEGYYRIDEKEFNYFIENQWLYLAEENQNLIGCVLMKPVDDITTSFSMLICHPDHRKKGVGKSLVDYIFKTAEEKDYQKMQLEILSPLHWIHEEKEFLKSWYSSLGFKLLKEVDFLEYYPTHDKYMKCPLLFSLYEKDLVN